MNGNERKRSKPITIQFFATITNQSVAQLIRAMNGYIDEGAEEIYLAIASQGGFLAPGIAAYNCIRGAPVEINTLAFGEVASMALVLYCAGSRRYAMPHTCFRFHDSALENPNEYDADFLGRLNQWSAFALARELKKGDLFVAGMIASSLGCSRKRILALMKKKSLLTSKDAIKIGLVTEIRDAFFTRDSDTHFITDELIGETISREKPS